MKKHMLPTLCLCVATLFFAYTAVTRVRIHRPLPIRGVTCEAPVFEFGETVVGSPIEHRFVLRNEGEAVVDLLDAKSGCSCTTIAELPRTRLGPRASAVVAVRFTPENTLGPQRQVVVVRTTDPLHERVLLQLRGTVVASRDP